MSLKIIARINGKLTVGIVCITACFARAAARPVFYHGIDTFRSPNTRLKTIAIGLSHGRRQGRAFSECAAETAPTGFGRDVNLRRKGRGNAQRAVFVRRDLTKLFDQRRIKSSRHSQRTWPHGDFTAGSRVKFRFGSGAVAGVGAIVGGNPETYTFAKCLQFVVPLGRDFGRLHSGDQHMPQMIFLQKFLLLIGQLRRVGFPSFKRFSVVRSGKIPACPGRNGLMRRIQHQTGNFFHAEFRRQVFGTLVIRQTPVFKRIQLTVFVQIFKGQSIDSQNFHP